MHNQPFTLEGFCRSLASISRLQTIYKKITGELFVVPNLNSIIYSELRSQLRALDNDKLNLSRHDLVDILTSIKSLEMTQLEPTVITLLARETQKIIRNASAQ
jgi:hypothetical protein